MARLSQQAKKTNPKLLNSVEIIHGALNAQRPGSGLPRADPGAQCSCHGTDGVGTAIVFSKWQLWWALRAACAGCRESRALLGPREVRVSALRGVRTGLARRSVAPGSSGQVPGRLRAGSWKVPRCFGLVQRSFFCLAGEGPRDSRRQAQPSCWLLESDVAGRDGVLGAVAGGDDWLPAAG